MICVTWAAAVNFGQFAVDVAAVVWAVAASSAVSANVFVLAVAYTVALAVVTVWNAVLADVVECPAAASAVVVLTSQVCAAVTESLDVDPGISAEKFHICDLLPGPLLLVLGVSGNVR